MTALSPTNTWNYYNPFYAVFALVLGEGRWGYARAVKSYGTEQEALDHKENAEAYLANLEDKYRRGEIDLAELDAQLRVNPWDSEAVVSATYAMTYFVLEVYQP